MARDVRSLAVGVILWASSVGGQTLPTTAPAEADVPEVRPFTLVFVVLDKETRDPIPGVKVRYMAQDAVGVFGGRGETDDAGVYDFELPTNKLSHLGTAIRKPGYIPMGTRWSGTIPTEYTLEMERGQTIGGTVVDGAGKPIVGAKVTLTVRRQASEPVAGFDIANDWVKTGDGGVWTYDRVPSGFDTAHISAADPRYVSGEGSSLGFTKKDEERVSEALAGRLVLTLREGVGAEGSVSDPDGRPVEGADVRFVYDNAAADLEATKTAKDGKFRVTYEAGRRPRLLILKEGLAPELVELPEEKDPAATSVHVALKQPRVLRVKVTDPAGAPIGGAWVSVTHWRGVRLTHTVRGDENGEATWPSAPAEELTLSIFARGYQPRTSLPLTPTAEQQVVALEPMR